MSDRKAETDVRTLWRELPTAGKVVLVSIVLGFVVRLASESTRTVNGQVTECSFTDFGALAFGATAILAGGLTLLTARAHPRRTLLIVVGLLGLGFGALHLARGTGSFHECGSGGTETSDAQSPSDFGPEDVTLPTVAASDTTGPTAEPGEVTTIIETATSLAGGTVTYTVPDDWTIDLTASATPTRQELSTATSPDGAIEVYGSLTGLTDDLLAEVPDELTSSGYESIELAGHPAWLLEESNDTYASIEVVLLVEDLQITMVLEADPGPPPDQQATIDEIIASLAAG